MEFSRAKTSQILGYFPSFQKSQTLRNSAKILKKSQNLQVCFNVGLFLQDCELKKNKEN